MSSLVLANYHQTGIYYERFKGKKKKNTPWTKKKSEIQEKKKKKQHLDQENIKENTILSKKKSKY